MVGRPKEIDELEVLKLKQSGMTNKEIANYLFINQTTVAKILKKYKGQYDASENRRHNAIDLTDEQKMHLYRLKKAGYSYNNIAEMTGFSKSFVMKQIKEMEERINGKQ